MDTLSLIDELIKTGEALVPLGGVSHYNGDRQPDYVAWRLQVISALEELRSVAKPLLKDIEADKKGPWFFKVSASRLLGALKAASAIAKRKPSGTGAILTVIAFGPTFHI